MSRDKAYTQWRPLVSGDKRTFTDIYDQYWAPLFQYVMRIVSNEDEAADIVQETFVAFWEVSSKTEKIKSIKAYLFIMGRNFAFRRFREQLKQKEVEDKLVEYYGSTSENLEQLIVSRELSLLLDDAIDKLPKRMREIFVLSRKEHLSYKQIAERLNISDQTVKKQIYHSLRHLRLRIDEEYIPYLSLLLLVDCLI